MIDYFKNNLKLFGTLFLAGLFFAVISVYLRPGFAYTHDGENHLARFANYKIALKEGQLPPRWAPNLMNHYGYPVFNFNYPLANMLSVPFSLIDFNYELSFKFIASSGILLGVWGIWSWLTVLELKYRAKLLGVTAYLLSPFVTITLWYRGNIGEILCLGLLPWLFWVVEVARRRKVKFWDYLLAIGLMSAFSLAHNTTVLLTAPLMLIYVMIRIPITHSRNWRRLAFWCLASLGLTLWFWLPAMVEKSQITLAGVSLSQTFNQHYLTWNQLWFNPLSFGFSEAGSIDTLGLAAGWWHGLVLLVSGVVISISRRRSLLLTMFSFTVVLLWLITPTSDVIWQFLPVTQFIQFPWRLLILTTITLVGVTALLTQKLPLSLIKVLLLMSIVPAVVLTRLSPVDTFSKNQIDYDLYSQSTSTNNENRPSNFDYQEIADWQPAPIILEGQAEVTVISWTGTSRTYQVSNPDGAVTVVEPTAYFAGWQTYSDREGRLSYTNSEDIQGRIAYELPTQEEPTIITTKFTQQTWPRQFGAVSFIITAAVLVIWTGRHAYLYYQAH